MSALTNRTNHIISVVLQFLKRFDYLSGSKNNQNPSSYLPMQLLVMGDDQSNYNTVHATDTLDRRYCEDTYFHSNTICNVPESHSNFIVIILNKIKAGCTNDRAVCS